jgi:hypothetical protein
MLVILFVATVVFLLLVARHGGRPAARPQRGDRVDRR